MSMPEEEQDLFSFPDAHRWKVFSTWGMAALLGFPIVYGATNYLASLRADRYHLFFSWETQTPFIKEFIFIYLSLNVVILLPLLMVNADRLKRYCQTNLVTLVSAGVFFFFFPTELGFARVIPDDPGLIRNLYESFFSIDKPHNLVPSLHVTFSTLALYSIMDTHRHRRWLVVLLAVWLILIAASIVFVRQHHVTDAVMGFALAYLGIKWVYARKHA